MRAVQQLFVSFTLGVAAMAAPMLGHFAQDAAAAGPQSGHAEIRDVANATADASNSVTVGDIRTGDAIAADVHVDARGATAPVVVSVAGSFPNSGVDIVAPGGNAQSGTTGGNGLSASNVLCDAAGAGDYSSRTSICNSNANTDQSIPRQIVFN